MTEEFYRKVTDLHNELVETEVLIQRLKDLLGTFIHLLPIL